MTALFGVILLAAAAVLITAAIYDARSYTIPNYVSLLLVILFPFYIFAAPQPVEWGPHVVVFAVAGAAGFLAFLMKWAGAGDAKLIAAAALWAGPHLIDLFLFLTALAGGVEALVILAVVRAKNRKAGEKVRLTKLPIPYGIAIAAGGLCVLSVLAQPLLTDRGIL